MRSIETRKIKLNIFLDPETDIIDQFLGPETDIMGERCYLKRAACKVLDLTDNQ